MDSIDRRPSFALHVALGVALGVALLTGALGGTSAWAQGAFASKPFKIINNFPPGGPSDQLARLAAEALQQAWRQTVIVENRAGVAGNLGADVVAKAPADGHTMLFGIDSVVTVNPQVYKSMPFKPAELKPVLIMASSGLLVGTSAASGLKSMAELIAEARSRGVTFSTAGSGSPGHLAGEQFALHTKAKVTHIPYKGNSPAVRAVVAGEVTGGMLATPGMLPHVKSGKVNALAVTSSQRSKLAPEVPTVAELGLAPLQQEVDYVVMVPAATPDAVVATLAKAITEALKRPEAQARLEQLDMQWQGLEGAAAARRLAALSEQYGRIVKATQMKAD